VQDDSHQPQPAFVSDPGVARRVSRRHLFGSTAYASAAAADYWLRVYRRAMACRFEVTLGGEDAAHVAAARQALDGVDAFERQLTVFRETSALVQVNRCAARAPVAVDNDLYELLALCRTLHGETEGAFDVTSTPLSRAWGFLKREGRVPSEAEIAAARRSVGMGWVHLDDRARTVGFQQDGVELNLGAIGKGWALDTVARGLRGRGVRRALLSAGRSSVLAIGSGRQPWPIDITSPRVGARMARVHLVRGALGTSGAGEQYFEADGRRFGHVIDPRTGWPAESGVLSVSVITSRAAVSDALSTAFLVGGVDLACRYSAAHPPMTAIVTMADSLRPRVIGSFPGAVVEAG
jgi:FAD:protein FMN transferase